MFEDEDNISLNELASHSHHNVKIADFLAQLKQAQLLATKQNREDLKEQRKQERALHMRQCKASKRLSNRGNYDNN